MGQKKQRRVMRLQAKRHQPRTDGHHRRLEEAGRTLPWRLQGDQSPVTS